MKIMLFVFSSLVIASNTQAQDLPTVYDTLARNQEFVLSGGVQLSSTAVSNSLSTYFIKGGEIPENVRSDNYNQHSDLNRIGITVNPQLFYANYNIRLLKKKDWGVLVKAGILTNISARYRSGLFGLAFLGNEQFLGSTIDFSNSNISIFGAHKVGFGLIDSKTKSSVSLNVYGITNYSYGYLNDASLTQDVNGYNAELMLKGQFEKTYRSTYYKGLGFGVDANFILPVDAFGQRSFIQFQVQNLGIGFLSDKIVRYAMDTTIQFNGFEVNDLVGDGALLNANNSVLDEIGLRQDTIKSDPIALPFTIQVGKIIDEHNTNLLQSYFGLQAMYQKGAIPMVFAGLQVRPTNWLRIGASVSYGGFSKFRGGVYLQAVVDQFNIGISTTNLIGMVSKKGLGQGYSLRINYRL